MTKADAAHLCAEAIVGLRDAVDRFIDSAMVARAGDPVALKKMLELSIEVQPAMEALVKAVAQKEK